MPSFPISGFHTMLQLILGIIFLSTGGVKLAHPSRFKQSIDEYQVIVLPERWMQPLLLFLSLSIPFGELLAGFGLVSGVAFLEAVILACGLLLLFSGAMVRNIQRGRYDLSCGCGGFLGNHRVSWWQVGRNAILLGGLLFLLATPADTFIDAPALLRMIVSHPIVWVNVVLPALFVLLSIGMILVLLASVRQAMR